MRIQSISMQSANATAYNTRKDSSNFNGRTYAIVPNGNQGDTFASWAAKNVLTASAFSIAWDLGTNACAKFSKNIDPISAKQMVKNVPIVAGIFMLIGGIFKAVSHIIDKK